MLISLSFLGLLYVLDDYKQKKIFFQNNFLTKIGYFFMFHGIWLIFSWWLKADKKPSESRRLKSRLSVCTRSLILTQTTFCAFEEITLHFYRALQLSAINHIILNYSMKINETHIKSIVKRFYWLWAFKHSSRVNVVLIKTRNYGPPGLRCSLRLRGG